MLCRRSKKSRAKSKCISCGMQRSIKWTLRRASAEFGVSVPTLVGKLNEAGDTADENKTFSTRSLVTALYGDVHRERLAKLKAEREQVELENAIMRGDYLSRVELENSFGQIANGIIPIIKASSLTQEQQVDLRRQISSIPVVIRGVARAQSRVSRNRGGDGSGPVRRPKRKAADSDGESRRRRAGRRLINQSSVISRSKNFAVSRIAAV